MQWIGREQGEQVTESQEANREGSNLKQARLAKSRTRVDDDSMMV